MKKRIPAMIAVLLVLVLTACGYGSGDEAAYKAGDILPFGKYEWVVLDVDEEEGRVLLLSTEIVTRRAYHTSDTKITWAECELRKYLNGVFIEESFTESDKMLIAESTVENADHPVYGTEGGSETADKVFLLSIDEVIKYFGDSGKIYGRADLKPGEYWTEEDGVLDDEYNEDRMAEDTDGSRWYWLLRSPGFLDSHAAYVQIDGIIFLYGGDVNVPECGIRPALWMEIG